MTKAQPNWQAWIFDLDDTLLDTSRELIPAAARRVCEFLVSKGASPSVHRCLSQWDTGRTQLSGPALIQSLIENGQQHFSTEDKEVLANKAYGIFRTPTVPVSLSFTPGGLEILKRASDQFPLFLVTQGDIPTQIRKVDALGIISYFQHVYYVDPFAGENKQQAFAHILLQNQLTPQRVLSIGNRLDNEIALSKREGMQTCYMRFGEHSYAKPSSPDEIPDFEVSSLKELLPLLIKNGDAV